MNFQMFKLDLEKAEETYQIANICWIIKKAREFQKNIYFCFIDYAKAKWVKLTILGTIDIQSIKSHNIHDEWWIFYSKKVFFTRNSKNQMIVKA